MGYALLRGYSMDTIVDFKALPYRKGVGMLVFNREGKVWIGRRLMTFAYANTDVSKLWQLPQGGLMKAKIH